MAETTKADLAHLRSHLEKAQKGWSLGWDFPQCSLPPSRGWKGRTAKWGHQGWVAWCQPAPRKAPTGLKVCRPPLDRVGLSLACTPDVTPGPLQPKLCYQDLHSALLLDPRHPQAKVLLKMMVDQAQKSCQDARILAVQGKLQHALQCINCAIENNPLDPSFFLFRYWVRRCQSWVPCLVSGEPLNLLRPQFPHLASNNLFLFSTGVEASWEVVFATAREGILEPQACCAVHGGSISPAQCTRLGGESGPAKD